MKNPKTKHISKIIKISAAALLLATVSVSCGNMAEYNFDDLGTYDEATAWNLNTVDTARKVNYLSTLEKDVLLEINKARTDPRAYAALYLLQYVKNGSASAAMKECIIEMKNTKALNALQPGKGLALAAKEWVTAQGAGGGVGHDMHTDPRIRKHWACSTWGENISYGYDDARKIVIQLLEDNSDPGRRHRKNILSRAYTHVGIGFGTHTRYDYMCVQDFVG